VARVTFDITMSGRVLVVDDSEMNRKTLTRLLETLGHDVECVEHGGWALERLRDAGPAIDIVLLDLVMPEMDGFETLAAIKADPALADMDLIRLSRLSVGRVTPAEWKHILKKSEKPGD
jgi:CheY-like chemotaxis protein